jgi:hypothetical protein
MELIGITLSGPVGFVLSMFYCWFLARALRRTERIRRVIRARERMAEGGAVKSWA